jgi:hypothetical protein
MTPPNGYGTKAVLEPELPPRHWLGRAAGALRHATHAKSRRREARAEPADVEASCWARRGGGSTSGKLRKL